MLTGIRVENGVTKNEGSESIPCFVHRKLDAGKSDFHTFFLPLISQPCYHWAFLNSGDFWSLPEEWIDELPALDEEEQPGTTLYDFHNLGYIFIYITIR